MKRHTFKVIILTSIIAISAYLYFNQTTNSQQLTISGAFEFNGKDITKDGFLFSRMQVTESLVGIDLNGKPYPLLASSWHQSEDGLSWRFTIRENVLFHDDSTMDSQSVVDSLNYSIARPGVINQVPIKTVSAQGSDVLITLSQRYRVLPEVLAHFSMGIISPSSLNSEGEIEQLYGTGPYQIDKLTPPHKAEFLKFNEYWGEPANIDNVSYLAGHRTESRAMLAQTGQVDIAYALDPISIDSLKASGQVDISLESMPRTVLIKLNNQHPLLNNVEIRHALSMAIDRKSITDSVLHIPDSEAHQIFSPSLGTWHDEAISINQRQLDQAQAIMSKHGWQKNDEGVLERQGERFELQLLTYADRPELLIIATALQAQLLELGVNIEVSIDNSSAIPARHNDNSLEMALVARNFGIIANPLPLLLEDTATAKGSDWGPTNWSSDSFNSLLAKLSTSQNNQAFDDLARQAAQVLYEEMPMIPINYYQQVVSVNKRLKNFSFDPFELNYHISKMQIND